ncbi:ANK-REP-REGION domain-containing protein [Mycena venus]|uniref:ANK-REP-REGION domain-containing protein n=1 Tax=Mycena venus TaxID=2733690 RepID=A0A8H7D0D7_9AGAR|nr:ANK-REP-REGION domain-containing protein [Mycena venus]
MSSPPELPDLRDTFGAIYIGVLFAAFFQGILTVQAYIYYESFPYDPWFLKTLVAVVWTLDLIHLGVIGSIPWNFLVVHWGNPSIFLKKSVELCVHIILVAAPTLICQGFFLHRLWRFSKKNWTLIGTLTLGSVTVFILDFYLTVNTLSSEDPNAYQHDTAEIVSMFSIGAITDLVIALALVWYLQRGATGFDSTNFVVTRIIQYTVATGLCSSLLAVACVIANVVKPQSFVFMALHFSLGRMYTNALLATLNSRRNLRLALGTKENLNTTVSTSAPVFFVSNQGTTATAATEEYSLEGTRGGKMA